MLPQPPTPIQSSSPTTPLNPGQYESATDNLDADVESPDPSRLEASFALPATFKLRFEQFRTSAALRQKLINAAVERDDQIPHVVPHTPLLELPWNTSHDAVADQIIDDLVGLSVGSKNWTDLWYRFNRVLYLNNPYRETNRYTDMILGRSLFLTAGLKSSYLLLRPKTSQRCLYMAPDSKRSAFGITIQSYYLAKAYYSQHHIRYSTTQYPFHYLTVVRTCSTEMIDSVLLLNSILH